MVRRLDFHRYVYGQQKMDSVIRVDIRVILVIHQLGHDLFLRFLKCVAFEALKSSFGVPDRRR